jgi:hypothetical protein
VSFSRKRIVTLQVGEVGGSLQPDKAELLEENASLKKGLEFLPGRYFSPGDCS